MLKSSPALSELTQGHYSQPPCCTHADTITIVPISCPCCHYAAAEGDMVQFPLVKETHTHTYTHFLTKQFLPSPAFFFSFCLMKNPNTYLFMCWHIHTAAWTLWPNSPLIDVCLSVKEAQHKEQRWACVWLRGNKEWSIPCQLSDSSGNTACACLSFGHIFELSDCMFNKEQQHGCFSVKERRPDWPPLVWVMPSLHFFFLSQE